MVFKPTSQIEYERGIKLRVLDTQISSLMRTIGRIGNMQLKGYALSEHDVARLAEAHRELTERRAARAALTRPTDAYGNFRALDPRARHEQMKRTHVIVGDHTPEPRTRDEIVQRNLDFNRQRAGITDAHMRRSSPRPAAPGSA